MAQLVHNAPEQRVRVPEWIYYFSEEQFIHWCRQHKLQISSAVRQFPEDERAAIFRYMVRQRLVE